MYVQCHQVRALHLALVPTTRDGNWQELQLAITADQLTRHYGLRCESELIVPNLVHGKWNQRSEQVHRGLLAE
jgi:hypothetical protein